MASVKLLGDEELCPQVRAVFDDIRATRKNDFVNNFWRALAHDPVQLERVWSQVKQVMGPGALDPLTKELIYVAVSIANNCEYCIGSHTAAARAKGMSDSQYHEVLAVIALASQTNRLATALRVPLDERFENPPER